MFLPLWQTSKEARVRLSLASREEQTRHLHPTIGTPVDVPLPRMVNFIPNLIWNLLKISELSDAGKAVYNEIRVGYTLHLLKLESFAIVAAL